MASYDLSSDSLLKYAANLNSYISACQDDPELKSFVSSLQQKTSILINSLNKKTENFSFDSVMKISDFLLELSQVVMTMIIENKGDVWKNEELKSLFDIYFESTTNTLNLFNTVEDWVKKAKISHLILRIAVKQFETESMDTDLGGNKNKYAKTLEELNKFKAQKDSFGDDFVKHYQSVRNQHSRLLDGICKVEEKLNEKGKKLKKWKKWVNVFSLTAVVSSLVLSMVSLVMNAPAGVAVVVGTGAVVTRAVGALGTWVNLSLVEYENALKTQKNLLLSTKHYTKLNIREMENIKVLVGKLSTRISLILETVEVAVEKKEEEPMKLAMQELMNDLEGFKERIEEVGEKAAKCSSVIVTMRMQVLEHMANAKGKW